MNKDKVTGNLKDMLEKIKALTPEEVTKLFEESGENDSPEKVASRGALKRFISGDSEHSIQRIYPLTIVADRYAGAYSGGRFLAFKRSADRDEFPEFLDFLDKVGGGDSDASEVWYDYKEGKYLETVGHVGMGLTPDTACWDLEAKLLLEDEYSSMEVCNREGCEEGCECG